MLSRLVQSLGDSIDLRPFRGRLHKIFIIPNEIGQKRSITLPEHIELFKFERCAIRLMYFYFEQ